MANIDPSAPPTALDEWPSADVQLTAAVVVEKLFAITWLSMLPA